jgi:adenine-specific DNA-methyltransferase
LAAIDDLIAQIEDEALRDRLRAEVERLTKEKKFGLVFEEHLPELTPIYSAPIRLGSQVARRDAPLTDVWHVLAVDSGQALCRNQASGEQRQMPTDDLVAVRRFGEPIFPAMMPMDRLQNGPDEAPWHTLIEADNYHALQLLEYLYSGQVDCIYIDPPYNSGARDWKYNNDYVDANDTWRHSKWLAFIRRRLVIARRLLKANGVLIITVDENEIYHLGCLLEQLFPSYIRQMITLVINPKGTGKKNFARVEEHALYCLPNIEDKSITGTKSPESVADEVTETDRSESFDPDNINTQLWELRHARRRGRESSYRHQRPNQFYPIYIDEQNRIVVKAGESLSSLDEEPYFETFNELRPIWPVDKEGNHRCWRFIPSTMQDLIDAGKVVLGSYNRKHDSWTLNIWERRPLETKPKTVWWNSLHDAGTHGTTLLHNILAERDVFPFPKSVYAVKDCLSTVVGKRKNAVILDFFAGSGTTLHAVNLLNVEDDGQRRCILVTNNEVSEDEAKSLTKQGYLPGDSEWERQGVCQSVTWPRSKYTILGRRDDGTYLEGDYLTGNTVGKAKPRTFRRLGYIDPKILGTAARKKEIVSLIEGIPMNYIKPETAFFVSEDAHHTAAILFDDAQSDAFMNALVGMDHIAHFYIVTRSNKLFQDLKAQISELLGPIEVQEEEKRPMREGFPANLEYFKLDFLEKDQVALGHQFRAILPLLWLRAGAVGPRPELMEDDSIPAMLFPAKNPFAVLVDETRFADFQVTVATRGDLTHVFLITDSEEAFQEMAAQLTVPHVIQLYRDYLENFTINWGNVS